MKSGWDWSLVVILLGRSHSTTLAVVTPVSFFLLRDRSLSILILSVVCPHGRSGVDLLLEIFICIGSGCTVAKSGSNVTPCDVSGLLLGDLRSVMAVLCEMCPPSWLLLVWIRLSPVIISILIFSLIHVDGSLWVILIWLVTWRLGWIVIVSLVVINLVVPLLLVVLVLHLNYEFAKFNYIN